MGKEVREGCKHRALPVREGRKRVVTEAKLICVDNFNLHITNIFNNDNQADESCTAEKCELLSDNKIQVFKTQENKHVNFNQKTVNKNSTPVICTPTPVLNENCDFTEKDSLNCPFTDPLEVTITVNNYFTPLQNLDDCDFTPRNDVNDNIDSNSQNEKNSFKDLKDQNDFKAKKLQVKNKSSVLKHDK